MKKNLLLFAMAFGISLSAQVTQQQRCGSDILPQQFENWVQSITPTGGIKGGTNSTQSVFNIPVIVHVIHNNEALNSVSATTGGNLNAAQIQDQINILNKDFNGLNPDTSLIPAVFKPYLGKFQFNFCMAVVNPTGGVLAEPGIDRINRTSKGWTAPPYSTTYIDATIKPNSIWDPTKYLNMWVCSISGGILGYATFPNPGSSGVAGIPTPYGSMTTDGLVMLNTAFGSIGTAVSGAPYNKGRTAVHELGHWVGLRHIWGDGTCATDYCNDTPPAQTSNFGCPTHPYKLGTCAGNTTGEMTMNFMDYTDDACMYMFTKDQKNRAQLIMQYSSMRAGLLTSTVCNLPSIGNDISLAFVSSPTYSQVINCNNYINPTVNVSNLGSTTITSAIFTYQLDNGAAQNYTWTGSLAPTASLNIALPQITNIANGAHVYSVSVSSPNGGTDNNMTNNSNMQNFSIAGSFTLSTVANPTSVCSGQSTTLTASGATSYTWSPGGITTATAAVSPTTATVYTLTGKTGTCSNTATLSVAVSSSLTLSVNTPSICNGSSVTLTATGATTYTWNTGATTSTIAVSPTATAVYTVNGTQGGCNGNKTTTVTVNTTPTVAVNNSTICSGNAATLTASGASTYSWNTGATTASIAPSPTATTVYTVTGTNGTCSNVKTSTITVNTSPTVTVNSPSICTGSSATLTAAGATTYSWSTGTTTTSLVLSPTLTTVYTVTGTTSGCTNIKTTTITVNTTPTVTVNSATICSGNAANLTASGATTYSWNTGATTASIAPTPTGTTIYTVTGMNGTCINVKTTTVTVNTTPTVTVNSATICSGNAANLTATGATTYSWNTGATTSTLAPTPSITTVYTVTGTSTGCTNVKTTTVTVNTTPTVTVNSATICSGNPANLTATGATTYSWNTGATTSTLAPTPSITTVYTVTGTSTGCTNVKTATVTVNTTPTVTVNSATICSGNAANLTAAGATTYSWNTGATTSTLAPTPSITTVYTVTGTSTGCTNVKTTTVTVNTTPTVNVNSFTICPGGSATLTATGASTYSWNTGSTANPLVISPTITTVYTTTGTTSGCSSIKTATVTLGTALSIALSPSIQTICAGNSATLSASGATSYTWNPGGFTGASIVVTPTTNATYNVVGASGACSGSNTANVNVSASPTLNVNPSSVTCFGLSNGSATLVPTGGAAPYTYSVSSGATTSVVTGLSAGNYTAIVTSSLGCSSTKTFAIVQPSAPLGGSMISSNASCGTCPDGSATVTATGGTAPYTYTWSPTGGNAATASGMAPACYTVTMADQSNCVTTLTTCVGFATGIKNNTAIANVNIYPNPTNGLVVIEFTNVDDRTIEITDMIGRIIATEKVSAQTVQISLSDYSNGVYYVVVKDGNGAKQFKIIKQ